MIKRAAKRYGIIDPINLAARVRRFAQPSEVQEPIELLRAGIVFHARGLINTRAIQYNLDWVWPYWVEKQFNPGDYSFIPRAFSFSHVNLTHRNWTAVGIPDIPVYPIVDPRGMLTPLYDGWSLDCWIVSDNGDTFLPSRLESAEQSMTFESGWRIVTRCEENGFALKSEVTAEAVDGNCRTILDVDGTIAGRSESGGWLIVAVRPYNPEGIQFIENIEFQDHPEPFMLINRHTRVTFDQRPAKVLMSSYAEGDVLQKWDTPETVRKVHCGVGMATAAAMFRIEDGGPENVAVAVDLSADVPSKRQSRGTRGCTWSECLAGVARLEVPDSRIQFLYDAAIRTLLLLSADDVVPGPYTYRRFWFRDACLMLNSMMAANFMERARWNINRFPRRQKVSGYFQSQEGEWDSNGQVLWIMKRYIDLSGEQMPRKWLKAMIKGADWIEKKRIAKKPGLRHGGLLPAGFSAEHLGPNDYYYWDDFWGVAGLKSAAALARRFDTNATAERFQRYADDFDQCIAGTIEEIPENRSQGCIPASPYRRMDAGAVGSLVADYPLRLTEPGNERITKTAEFLIENCFFKGAFFQDMIHSGINAYLTLDIAQTLLRAGDSRYRELIETVAELASPTGQWPEAIHPLTLGGCMGDGQHGWAASEWVMMIRNLFVREEDDRLIIGSGVFPQWIDSGRPLRFGPTPTVYGTISVNIEKIEDEVDVVLETSWRSEAPGRIEIRLPDRPARTVPETSLSTIKIRV